MPAPRMSSQLDQTSAILGEYMLKGWTLTDLHCDTCRVTPLMREPAAVAQREGRTSIQFCALCDGSPAGQSTTPLSPPSSSNQPSASVPAKHDPEPSSSYAATSEDPASQISSLLLKGYSLLGTNCPNSTCRGIPLVGFPRKADKTRDGRRMCVSCHGRWVEEGNMGGLKIIAPPRTKIEETRDDRSLLEASEESRSPREKRRRELYGLDVPSVGKQDSKGKNREDEDDFDVDMDIEGPIPPPKEAASKDLPSLATNASLNSALHAAQSSLALTLSRLAISLEQHHTSDEARYFVDVKLHTEAMRDVLDVLERMKRVIS
ncbi:hypothetical protein BCR39DRAFT_591902 [Naematelia encephala]|uniref:Uncharacterized protein n=1 Tax=Naematelia encephala TaxID=71784 RepID=A0A1Y2BKS8_9TREE|nr:hypothetical protein BCR39DRAFT_591902 [Naematelia encephala]